MATNSIITNFRHKKRPIVIGLIVLFLIFGLINGQKIIANTIESLHLSPQPETFTELYFENHTTLPNSITRGELYHFSFTLHNLEYQTTTYPYKIYIQRDTAIVPLEEGSVTLNHDSYKTINIEFGPLKNLRSMIVVDLVNKKQQIDFWMEAK